MAIEDHHFRHDHQLPFDHTIWTDYPLQNHCTPSPSSTPLRAPNLLITQMANLKKQEEEEEPEEELGAMKEMMFKIAAMQPVDIDPATIRKPKRQNVRISDDPQSVAARHRREKISEKMRILQRLVPGVLLRRTPYASHCNATTLRQCAVAFAGYEAGDVPHTQW
ncbi:unnamed protein product [Fraxinus pennsylvanica]|uniref:BHLH domain-containing protein n=1 Tax=Fraxinus pennsylvanica TaxID=56036 RepID=A0AAD1YKR2_9LAMI|nr:unnamed protein product [Fraxinus pennsylvanica]